MDIVQCPECRSWDIHDLDIDEFQCMECGTTFRQDVGDQIPA